MSDKCSIFDRIPCDRLTKAEADVKEALEQKRFAREEANRLHIELTELKEQHHGVCRERDELRALLDEIRGLMANL